MEGRFERFLVDPPALREEIKRLFEARPADFAQQVRALRNVVQRPQVPTQLLPGDPPLEARVNYTAYTLGPAQGLIVHQWQVSLVYGAFATTIAILLSLEIAAVVLLLGAQVIAVYERRLAKERAAKRATAGG